MYHIKKKKEKKEKKKRKKRSKSSQDMKIFSFRNTVSFGRNL